MMVTYCCLAAVQKVAGVARVVRAKEGGAGRLDRR